MENLEHYLGIFEGHFDPAVSIVRDGRVIAYAEEERFIRYKHAYRVYPRRALQYCLNAAGIGPESIAAIGINWNIDAYTDGSMEAFFAEMAELWPLDPATKSWQRAMLGGFHRNACETRHAREWRQLFGDQKLPPILGLPHHFTHALQSYLQSPFEDTLLGPMLI